MTQDSLIEAGAGQPNGAQAARSQDEHPFGVLDLAILMAERWKLLIFGSVGAGLLALGVTYLIAPTFTARTVFLPPQQQQSAAGSTLASLGALSSLAGAATSIRSPIDQYVALMQSITVADRIIDRFDLMRVYDRKFRQDARLDLAKRVRIAVGKRDGLITVEVDDGDPKRAADIANSHVEELRKLTSLLALTEAQQRRLFFEQQLAQTRDKLTQAQAALQGSGFSPGALKAEPRAAAEGYAKLRAEVTAAEVRLQTLRNNLADATPEVQQQGAMVAALRAQLGKLEVASNATADGGYVAKYREFKYQEALSEQFSRQYEIARLDESHEGAMIQVIDAASPPERKSQPKRVYVAVATTGAVGTLLLLFVVIRRVLANSANDPEWAAGVQRLRRALGRA